MIHGGQNYAPNDSHGALTGAARPPPTSRTFVLPGAIVGGASGKATVDVVMKLYLLNDVGIEFDEA